MLKGLHILKAARTHSILYIIFIFLCLSLSLPFQLYAKVEGQCANCHTMHNSQQGSAVLRTGTGTGWNGSGQLTGGSIQSTPTQNLLVTDCVGCHSSTTSNTIITVGTSTIPIVYNTGGYPASPLAGGNFYHVAQGAANDQYGHNVYGISGQDSNLNEAPGTIDSCAAGECHQTLAASNNSRGKPGCQGCHFLTFHHIEDNTTSSNTGYRFLWGHTYSGGNYTAYVEGVEDNDWEFTKSSSDHNNYKGTTATYSYGSALADYHGITAFCAGCHRVFHGPYESGTGRGMGSASPWMRHPNDILLPQTGEYAAYITYSTQAPVAYTDPLNPSRATAIVMCLSCHRAHGSDQPDMLRWDYSTMIAGGGGSGGCFTCHTQKN